MRLSFVFLLLSIFLGIAAFFVGDQRVLFVQASYFITWGIMSVLEDINITLKGKRDD